jgi:cholesterol transport system auxiliary component
MHGKINFEEVAQNGARPRRHHLASSCPLWRRGHAPLCAFYVAVATAVLAGSCATTRPVHYYTLGPASAPTNPPQPDGPTILAGAIATPEFLQDARIRYRAGTNRTGSYEYHRWTERPGAMVRDSLARALRASGKYQRVLESSSSAVGDYLVRGKLYEFGEVDDPAIQTKISLRLELVDIKTGRSVWDDAFEREEPASGKNIGDVVESMDRNLRRVASDAAAEIGRFLASRR